MKDMIKETFLISRPCVWIILLAAMLAFIVVGASEDADAVDWKGKYTVRFDAEPWERVDADGDHVYVTYLRDIGGNDIGFMRFHNGTQWSTELAIGGSQYQMSAPVVVAVDDKAHIAYVDWTDGDGDIYYTIYSKGSWQRPIQVSIPIAGVEAWHPEMDVEDGLAHIVWSEDTDGDRDIYYRTVRGAVMSNIVEISVDPRTETNNFPSINVHDGDIHVTYTMFTGSDNDIYHRMFNGSWSDPYEVGNMASADWQYYPQTVVTSEGIHVFYSQRDSGGDTLTYMRTFTGDKWVTPKYVGRATASGNELMMRVAAEEDHMVITYSTDISPSKILFRHYSNGSWEDEVVVDSLTSGIVRLPDIDLVDGTVHIVWRAYDSRTRAYNTMYIAGDLEIDPPSASVQPIDPYWLPSARLMLSWEATDDYWLSSVVLQYRYSDDNATWGRWTEVRTIDAHGQYMNGVVSFRPTDGDGYYEFKAYARDTSGKSEAPSNDPEAMAGYDTLAPTGSISINEGDEYTGDPNVTLHLVYEDSTSGVDKVRFGEETVGGDEPWENPVRTKEWELGTAEGEYTIAYQVIDLSGKVSQVYTDTIFLDLADPYGTITMTAIPEWTSKPDIDLNITYEDTGSGVSKVRFADEMVGGDEPWDNPAPTKRWTLPEGEGTHTVAYQIMDAAGRTSEVYTFSIGLDTVAPKGSIIIEGGDTYTTERAVTLTLTAEDVTSGVAGIRVGNEEFVGGDEPWDNKVDTLEWELPEGSGLKTVYYQVLDVAGLASEVYTATITLDVDVPTGAIALSTGGDVINTRSVELALTFEDLTTDIVGIRVQEEAVGGDEPWDNPVETMSFQLSPDDGMKTIYFQVLDEAGHVSDVYQLSFMLDTSNPTVVETDPAALATDVPVNKVILVRFSEIMDKNSVERAFTLSFMDAGVPNNVGGTFNWSTDGKSVTFTPLGSLNENTVYTITITDDAWDAANNPLFPPLASTFTTVKDGGGNGGNGGDGGDGGFGSLFVLLLVAGVFVVIVVVASLYYFVKVDRKQQEEED
jgi:hypothetical protein